MGRGWGDDPGVADGATILGPAGELSSAQAQVALHEWRTGAPVAYLAGTWITNARTGCVGALATRALATEPVRLAVIGAGAQARWQTRAIAAAVDVESVRMYSPSDSREACAAELRAEGLPAETVATPADALEDATVVVTATTGSAPVFQPDALAAELVVAVGAYRQDMQELDPAVLELVTAVFADVPEEAAETGDLLAAYLDAADVRPLADAFDDDRAGPRIGRSPDGLAVVKSVGSAVLDATTATWVYGAARERGIGREVSL